MEVYFLAHKPWMQWIINNVQEAVFKMLYNSPWNESNIQTLVWEGKYYLLLLFNCIFEIFNIYYYH
jgi:hypothetical protein